ncbi:MAG: hypothetical protein KGZ37_08805 [Nitrosarchaeum sp.]|nr:hypothetical protein [Nitrosarchaeum sp.]
MKNKILLIIIGIVITCVLLGIAFSQPPSQPILREPMEYPELNLSYVDSNSVLKSSLISNGILMSSPLKFTGDSIAQYCTFYQDDIKQNSITYCTSTELKDSDGKFLGNIHMVGTLDSPNAVLGVIQTDPYLSNLDSLKTTYQIMMDSLVCDCWQDKKPGNFESMSQWIDAAKSHHFEAKRTTSSSEISGLADKQLFLEITTNSEGYLWKLIISN